MTDAKLKEVELVQETTVESFTEWYFNSMKELPSLERLRSEFPNCTDENLKEKTDVATEKMEKKGYDLKKSDYLTPKQLAVANSILNLADRRSNRKKLEDFGVSSAQFGNWKKSAKFNAYLRERSEESLGNAVSDVHMALIDSASSGDVSAMKLFYEITGRHTSGSQQITNVKTMLIQVIEAVQRHVKDPAVLQAIAADIQLSSGGILQGELVE